MDRATEVLMASAKSRLRRLRFSRLGFHGMASIFLGGFSYVLVTHSDVSLGLGLMLGGLLMGFFASFALASRVSAEIVNEKLTIKLLGDGLFGYLEKIMNEIGEGK